MKKTLFFVAAFAVCGSSLVASKGANTSAPATDATATTVDASAADTSAPKPGGVFSKAWNGMNACANFVYPDTIANMIRTNADKRPLTTAVVLAGLGVAAAKAAEMVYEQLNEEEDDEFSFDA